MKNKKYYNMFYNVYRCDDCIKYELNQEFCLETFKCERADAQFYEGQEINIDKLYVDINTEGYKIDFLYIAYCNGFNVTPRFKKILEKFNIGKAQYIPIYITNTDELIGYHVNLLEYYNEDSINMEKSNINKDFNRIVYPCFYYEVIKNKDLLSYRVKEEDLVWDLYVSSRLKREIEKKHIRGLHFIEMEIS